jgi:hypothetical protein
MRGAENYFKRERSLKSLTNISQDLRVTSYRNGEGKMSVSEHKKEAPKKVNCKVITVSDTRSKQTDKSGGLIINML